MVQSRAMLQSDKYSVNHDRVIMHAINPVDSDTDVAFSIISVVWWELCFDLFQSKVEKITGHAQFSEDKQIEVAGQKYSAKHIVIATGGRPSMSNIPGES